MSILYLRSEPFGHPMRSITCPSRRASREGGKLVARTQLPRLDCTRCPHAAALNYRAVFFLRSYSANTAVSTSWRILPLSCTVSNQACCPSGAGAVVQKIRTVAIPSSPWLISISLSHDLSLSQDQFRSRSSRPTGAVSGRDSPLSFSLLLEKRRSPLV